MLRASVVSILLLIASPAFAQSLFDANTLPRGVGAFLFSPSLSSGTSRFGPRNGFTRESILTDVNNIDLSEVLAGDDAAMLRAVIGDLGVTNFSGTQLTTGFDFILGYGITDRLTVIGAVGYGRANFQLRASLTPGPNQSNFRVSNPEAIQCEQGNFQLDSVDDLFTILEDGGPGYQFNIGDLRRAISSQCLGYRDPFTETVVNANGLLEARADGTYAGFRDSAIGIKYKLWHTKRLGLSLLSYVIIPTGRVEDPDDLFDPQLGDGQWDLAALAAATYTPFDRMQISLASGYEVQFSHTLERRLFGLSFSDELETQLAEGTITEEELYDRHLDDGSLLPLVTAYDKSNATRDLGNNIYVYLTFAYQITDYLGVSVGADYLYHFRDRLRDTGTRLEDGTRFPTSDEIRAEVDQLIADGVIPEERRIAELKARLPSSASRKEAAFAWQTVRQQLALRANIAFNTVKWFLDGDFPVPFFLSLGGSYFAAGQNIGVADAVGITLGIPFVTTTDIKDPAEYGFDDEGPGKGLPWP